MVYFSPRHTPLSGGRVGWVTLLVSLVGGYSWGMVDRLQFSLRDMMIEVSLLALALGLTFASGQSDDLPIVLGPFLMVTWGAAAGGLARRIRLGAIVGFCLYPVLIAANFLAR